MYVQIKENETKNLIWSYLNRNCQKKEEIQKFFICQKEAMTTINVENTTRLTNEQ